MDNPTIGLLLCKEKDILDKLPTEDEINLYLDIEGDENDE